MKVIIVGNMRSGTTVINESLGCPSELSLTHEILHSSSEGGNVTWRDAYWPSDLFHSSNINNKKKQPVYIDIISQVLEMYDGFKIVYDQLHSQSQLWTFLTNQCRIIHLLRDDKFQMAASAALSTANGKWQRKPSESWKDKPIFIDPDWLATNIERSEQWEEDFRKMLPDALEVHYEDFEEWDKTMSRILKFLDLKQETLPPTLAKRTTNYSEVITNYKKLKTDPKFHKYFKSLKYFL